MRHRLSGIPTYGLNNNNNNNNTQRRNAELQRRLVTGQLGDIRLEVNSGVLRSSGVRHLYILH